MDVFPRLWRTKNGFPFPPSAEQKKVAYKERLRRDLLIASQRVLLLAACGEQNSRTKKKPRHRRKTCFLLRKFGQKCHVWGLFFF
jgi:hypothetical protein